MITQLSTKTACFIRSVCELRMLCSFYEKFLNGLVAIFSEFLFQPKVGRLRCDVQDGVGWFTPPGLIQSAWFVNDGWRPNKGGRNAFKPWGAQFPSNTPLWKWLYKLNTNWFSVVTSFGLFLWNIKNYEQKYCDLLSKSDFSSAHLSFFVKPHCGTSRLLCFTSGCLLLKFAEVVHCASNDVAFVVLSHVIFTDVDKMQNICCQLAMF